MVDNLFQLSSGARPLFKPQELSNFVHFSEFGLDFQLSFNFSLFYICLSSQLIHTHYSIMSTLTLHYTNTRGLFSNKTSVFLHFEDGKPSILALSETQIDINKSNAPDLQFRKYILHAKFRRYNGVCCYVRINIPCERLTFLEKNDFDALWLKINTKATSRFLCTIYRSPNDKRYNQFFWISRQLCLWNSITFSKFRSLFLGRLQCT